MTNGGAPEHVLHVTTNVTRSTFPFAGPVPFLERLVVSFVFNALRFTHLGDVTLNERPDSVR